MFLGARNWFLVPKISVLLGGTVKKHRLSPRDTPRSFPRVFWAIVVVLRFTRVVVSHSIGTCVDCVFALVASPLDVLLSPPKLKFLLLGPRF